MDAQQDRSWDPSSIGRLCGRCLNDAGHQCGMAGAARCAHIEGWDGGRQPDTWSATEAGPWSCSDFEADLVVSEGEYLN